jgi:hypothetical protein
LLATFIAEFIVLANLNLNRLKAVVTFPVYWLGMPELANGGKEVESGNLFG